MSLLNWLATQARGVGAQLNQWDGGATYNSVVEEERRKRQQQPQQPQRPVQQWQPPQQRPQPVKKKRTVEVTVRRTLTRYNSESLY